MGDPETAEGLLRTALRRTEDSPDDFPLERSRIRTALALTLLQRGRVEEACGHAQESRATLAAVLGSAHWRTARAEAVEGLCLVRTGDVRAGEHAVREGFRRLEAARPPGDLHRRDAERWVDMAAAQSQRT